MRQYLPVQPRPHVTKDQRHTHIQQPQQRITRTRANTRLLHLTVTGLDPKTLPVALAHPRIRTGTQTTSIGVQQRLTTVLATLTTTVATLDTDQHRGPLLVITLQAVAAPAALGPQGEHPAAAGTTGMVGLAAPLHQRHQERIAAALQVADHSHRAESPVQQQVTRPDRRLGRLPQQLPENLRERLALADRTQSHRKALPLADNIGGGVGMEVAGAVAGLAAVDLVVADQWLAVVGHQLEVDSQGLTASA